MMSRTYYTEKAIHRSNTQKLENKQRRLQTNPIKETNDEMPQVGDGRRAGIKLRSLAVDDHGSRQALRWGGSPSDNVGSVDMDPFSVASSESSPVASVRSVKTKPSSELLASNSEQRRRLEAVCARRCREVRDDVGGGGVEGAPEEQRPRLKSHQCLVLVMKTKVVIVGREVWVEVAVRDMGKGGRE